MDLYPRNITARLDLALFRDPPAEYRGVPFWAWNGKLTRDLLLRQITIFRQMGFGGFHIHPRLGLTTTYLSDEFMGLVQACVEQARREGMRAWLYDEDRWPSGFAGGLVTRDIVHRAKHLLLTRAPYGTPPAPAPPLDYFEAPRAENGLLLARYHVMLADGRLRRYRRLAAADPAPTDGELWYAYIETALESPWFNHQTYVDTLSTAAIERFIAVTHERYAAVVGPWFGEVIPAIFTDEPEFVQKKSLTQATAAGDVTIPWTTDFDVTYAAAYGQPLLDRLPELFWDSDTLAPTVRYRYHDHLAERFSAAFGDTIGAWCARHGLLLTGHMMEEPTLQSQTAAVGEVMRALRGFDLPGIDLLADWREYTTAKQAQSVAHQYGRAGVVSELYGVTGWDFDFVGHKAQGDWQAALGVTVRVHHLAWVSMKGESKRDYPASIGYQSPWHTEYRLVEDYFARINTVLTRGQRRVRIAVIHPIESYWLVCGPLDQTTRAREDCERWFSEITDWLLFACLDFDFVAESLLPSLCADVVDLPLRVGAAAYDVVVVPALRTMRATTLSRLAQFQRAG
ncbi:MAG: hypothetical protein H7Y32_15710, partial [Chloroflexales bacterium]|nr:hypothetical protein [Chloroflexales bacterium]